MKFLSSLEPLAYAALRIVVGFLFACHGAEKLFGAFGAHAQLHDPWMLAAGIIEFGGGILVCLGLMTRIAAFLCSGEMAVAYFMKYAGGGMRFFPIVNHGEAAVIYCFVFFYIACHGAGKVGVDKG
jgi:putative oxidoreductase